MSRLAGLLLPLTAALPAIENRASRPDFCWFTQFGDRVLQRVDSVLSGKVESVTPVRGTDVVRVSILAWHFGERRPDQREVTLLARRGDFFTGTEQLLFLQRFEGGGRYQLHNRVARSDPDYEAKLRCLEENLALLELERVEDRRLRARRLLHEGVGDRERWTRWHAFHELAYVRDAYPDLVTADDREEFTRLAARSDDAPFKKALLKLLKEWTS